MYCPNKNSKEFKDLVKTLGSEEKAYIMWNKLYTEEINISNKKYENYEVINGMPFQSSTIEKMKVGDQRITIRTRNYKDGIYTIGGEQYHILNLGRKNIANFKNKEHLKKKFKGDDYEEGKFKHIDEFFEGKQNLFVYQITKINNEIKNENVKLVKELENVPNEVIIDNKVKEIAFETQYVFFKRRISRLEKELSRIPENTDQHTILSNELEGYVERFNKATEAKDKSEYIALAQDHLDWVENLVNTIPNRTDEEYIIKDLTEAFEILNAFIEFTGLGGRPAELREKLFPYIVKHNLKTINNFNTSGENITEEMIDGQNTDIRSSAGYFGSLSDLANYIGRTIGSVVKAAQNSSSTLNKQFEAKIQKEVDELSEYAKSNNTTLEEIYELMTQESKNGTLVLAQKYNKEGELNKNYEKIQNTPELKQFYDFYQRTLKIAESNLPYKVGRFYVLNKVKTEGIKENLSKIIPSENILFDSFISNEELIADMVPDMFRNNIPADKKSKDLASGLLEFVAYSNNHAALSKALPEARLLQEQLRYKQDENGNISERQFIKSSDPKSKVNAEDSNIYKMVNTYIDMQLKGKMTVYKMKPIKTGKIKDREGNIIGYKQVHIEDVIDRGLRWNSLLRIGFSPITAITNVLFGDISNILESVGGRFFNVKELKQATNIFFKQTEFVSKEKSSNMYKWLEKLNPLQELADYDLGANLQANAKKLSAEKALELAYSMQKKGELFLQTRTMIAVLIHDGYLNPDGTNTKKGNEITENEAIKLSDKIQRINQLIHGRYSQREASALQQSVWFRAAIQFRKWIPSAIEQRFGDKKYDNRLGVEIEGRYRTLKNKVFKADSITEAFHNLFIPVLNSKKALESGNMTPTEIYNMRKNMTELILLLATVLTIAWTKSGDDEERRKKLKNPYIKMGLTMLNRISGDLMFFYNPENVANISKNAIPMSKLISDLIHVGTSIPHALYLGDYEVKRGSLKGTNSFYSKDVVKVIPGLSPLAQIQKILNDEDILPELN